MNFRWCSSTWTILSRSMTPMGTWWDPGCSRKSAMRRTISSTASVTTTMIRLVPRVASGLCGFTVSDTRPGERSLDAIAELVPEAQKIVKILKGRKTNSPRDAYFYMASVPPEMLVFIEAEMPSSAAASALIRPNCPPPRMPKVVFRIRIYL